MSELVELSSPYLLFLGDARDDLAAKTAAGVHHWRPRQCLGQLRLPGCAADLKLTDMTPAEAARQGARTMLIGTANSGGVIADNWLPGIVEALEAGLDVASGLHERLDQIPTLMAVSARTGRRLIDVRHPKGKLKTGTGRKRSGKRLLTVGTDCSVGKMYTSLALEAALREKGCKADFRATGQTGIMIVGRGISVDAVVADFIAGAAEALSPDNDADHWDVVEGQGSLHHPAFAGVSLGLLHGSQPDALVICHEPTRRHMRGLSDVPLPSLEATIEANLSAARLTNPNVRVLGFAVNTSKLEVAAARSMLDDLEKRFRMPASDPVRFGVAALAARLLAEF
ncbi:MAG: DUF1611 domain-containing protein [Proteobacteria bacterium]|jgi:uncharacterized NAD-dependent epimerase/dehydratase family protein|nr:MAG: DUF1611 domain-containing protein [Pseudomonadota bacterium]